MALPNPLMQRLQEMLHARAQQPPMRGELMAPAHHQHRFQELLHGRTHEPPMHGESFGPQAAPQMQEPLAALTAALDTRTHGPIPGMVGENFGGGHGGAPDTRTHGPIPGMRGEHGAGGGLGLALGDWAHLPAPPPPSGGIHWFGPGGSGIAYPTPNGGGPEVFGAGPIGSHGQVYTEPIRRRPALANALQVS